MEENDVLKGKTAAFVSLGCKLNFAENAALSDRLQKEGVRRAAQGEAADICIINTCTVTETSNHKSRQAIHRAVRENPGALVVVMGCYAQACAEEVAAIEGVGLVVGMEDKGRMVELLRQHLPLPDTAPQEADESLHHIIYRTERRDIVSFVPSCSRGTRTRYFIKIQDGCDYFCTYCAIPMARGRSRNGSVESIVKQAREAARKGAKEIVITGVNIGDFGKSTHENLLDLLKRLDEIESIGRYRISSIEPNLLTEEIIRFCAESRAFMPHFHIPLQSGSDEVLKLMRRRYDKAFFREKIQTVREQIPDAFIGVDIIVGMRGETPELFEESCRFVQNLDVSQLHVFTYSERPRTAALNIPYVVAENEKHSRSQRLIAISEEKRKAFYRRHVGTERPVLTEHGRDGEPVRGFTDNYIRVELPALARTNPLADNNIVGVRLGDFNADGTALIGTIIL